MELSRQSSIAAVGIMSGTSIDGVDFVLSHVDRRGPDIRFMDMASYAFPRELRRRLQKAADHKLLVDELAELHFDLGRFYADRLRAVQRRKRWKFSLIGLHGQTVYHRGRHATLQIGEPSFLAAATAASVVCQFRNADLAWGGEGAPLAPLFHQAAFQRRIPRQAYAFHNLGGISNLTVVRPGTGAVLAFDTGPANMLIDLLCLRRFQKPFDRGGRLARQGSIHEKALREFLRHPYFRKSPPKSCGREEFGEKYLRKVMAKHPGVSGVDWLATATEFTAVTIAQSYRRFVRPMVKTIIFSGGGAKNDFLLERIGAHLPEVRIQTSEDLGWPSSAIEGGAFALLAAYRVWNLPGNIRKATGARAEIPLGQIYTP